MTRAPFYANVSSRFGAPMGRTSDHNMTGKLTLVRVPPYDGGDYDPGGAYWGSVAGAVGLPPLWCAYGDEGACYVRAESRAHARTLVLADNPKEAQ